MTRNSAAKKIVGADNTVPEPARAPQLAPYHYKPGQSGNPTGRPRGARSKLSEKVIAALLDSFEANGAATIEEVRRKSPANYLAAVVSLLPKQQEKLDSPFSDLTENELDLLEQFLKSTRAKTVSSIVLTVADSSQLPRSYEAPQDDACDTSNTQESSSHDP